MVTPWVCALPPSPAPVDPSALSANKASLTHSFNRHFSITCHGPDAGLYQELPKDNPQANHANGRDSEAVRCLCQSWRFCWQAILQVTHSPLVS